MSDVLGGEISKPRVEVAGTVMKMREPKLTMKQLQKPDARMLELFTPVQWVRFDIEFLHKRRCLLDSESSQLV